MALAAGCDVCLVCNDRAAVDTLLGGLSVQVEPLSLVRMMRMHGRASLEEVELAAHPRRLAAQASLAALQAEPELELGDDAPA